MFYHQLGIRIILQSVRSFFQKIGNFQNGVISHLYFTAMLRKNRYTVKDVVMKR